MPYARIYLTREKKQEDVDVQEIKDFWNIYSSGGDPTKKAFKVKKDEKFVNCQVLRVAETMEILAKEVLSKRAHVPKLNASLFEDEMNQRDVQQTVKKNKNKKAEGITRKASAKTDTVGEILDAYMKVLPDPTPTPAPAPKRDIRTPRNETTKKVDNCQNKVCEVSSKSFIKHLEETSSNGDGESESVKSIDERSTTSAEEMMNPEMDRYLEDFDAHTQWRNMYFELKDSKQFPLTEATGQLILGILRREKGSAASLNTVRNQDYVPYVDPEMIDLGGGFKIKQCIYETISKCNEPGRFISSLAQYVWGVETLAKRCVRVQANVKELQLEDDKKGIILKQFKIWLRNLEYPSPAIDREMNKINKYLNSAITAARKKLKRNADAGDKCADSENEDDNNNQQKSSKSRQHTVLPAAAKSPTSKSSSEIGSKKLTTNSDAGDKCAEKENHDDNNDQQTSSKSKQRLVVPEHKKRPAASKSPTSESSSEIASKKLKRQITQYQLELDVEHLAGDDPKNDSHYISTDSVSADPAQ